MRTCEVCEADNATRLEYFESADPAADSVNVDLCIGCMPKVEVYSDAMRVRADSFADDEGDAERDEA